MRGIIVPACYNTEIKSMSLRRPLWDGLIMPVKGLGRAFVMKKQESMAQTRKAANMLTEHTPHRGVGWFAATSLF